MSNLFTIWSPGGEKFEVSRPNYNDLRAHGWLTEAPTATSTAAIAAATKDKASGEEAKPVRSEGAGSEPAAADAPESAESEHAAAGESAEGSEAGEGSSDSGTEEVTKESLIEALAKFGVTADKRKSLAQLQALLTEAEEATGKRAE